MVSNPNGVNLHQAQLDLEATEESFKPQRGKFTQLGIVYLLGTQAFQTPTG